MDEIARRRAARPHCGRAHQARAAAGAVHRVGDRDNGHAVSSVSKTTLELAERYLMQTGRRLPVTFIRGLGCKVYDEAGHEYLDLVAGIAVNLLGHSHPDVVRALSAQADSLIHTSNLYFTRPQIELARRLVASGVGRWRARLVSGLLNECDAVHYAHYIPAPARAEADEVCEVLARALVG